MSTLRAAVVAISGSIGSGKTTTAVLLSRRTGWPLTSYGDVVRRMAGHGGGQPDRHDLQRTGAELIASGWDSFSRRVLSLADWQPGEPVIVEGIRHAAAIVALRRITRPLPLVTIYLDLPAETAMARARTRDNLTAEQSRLESAHPVERDLSAARALADLVVFVSGHAPEAIADSIVAYLAAPIGAH